MNDLVQHTTGQNQMLAQFNQKAGLPSGINAGSVSIEQERAIAEARGQLQLAKMFPRDLIKSHSELMAACKSKAFAGAAFYSVPRAGGAVTGPSIRLAEEIARVVGNFTYGHRELSRDDHKSEVEVFAWDLENNNRSIRQLTVMHVIDTKQGPKACRDQKDIDDKISNVASKQVRGRILALIPKWLLEDAILECKKTLTGNNDEPLEVRIRKMTQAFAKFGVSGDHLETYLGHKLTETMVDELIDLQGIYNALKEGAKPSEYFGQKDDQDQGSDQQAADVIRQAAASGAATKTAETQKPRRSAEKKQPAAEVPQQSAEQGAKEPEQNSTSDQNNSNVVKDGPQQADVEAVASQQGADSATESEVKQEEDLF